MGGTDLPTANGRTPLARIAADELFERTFTSLILTNLRLMRCGASAVRDRRSAKTVLSESSGPTTSASVSRMLAPSGLHKTEPSSRAGLAVAFAHLDGTWLRAQAQRCRFRSQHLSESPSLSNISLDTAGSRREDQFSR
jgi:hypothetical protein